MADYIAWKDIYSVGDPALDAQHNQVICLINDLYTAMDRGKDRAVLEPLLDRLVEYTYTHFHDEEQVLEEHGYPDLARHKAAHDRMRERTANLRNQVDLVTGPELLRFLKEWWLNHIQSEDKKYAPYLTVPAPS